MRTFSLTFSLAELSFSRTRSIGLLNQNVKMLESLALRPEISRLTLLSNHTLEGALNLPKGVEVEVHDEGMGRGIARILWDQWGVMDAAKKTGNDWLLMPKGFVSFVRPCSCKLAVYIPDAMFDYCKRMYTNNSLNLETVYLTASVKAAMRQAKVIFTNSEFTNHELRRVAKNWGIKLPPLVAVGIGFSHVRRMELPKVNRVVAVISPFPHKRTDLCIEYLARWQKETGFEGAVDFAGALPPGLALPPFKNWKLHGRIPEEEFRKMIAEARALLNFTEYEGFGMPPVESIIQGTCAVYSDIPASREVLDGMGAPFLNQSYESFASAMKRALEATQEEIREWAQRLQERHNWEKGTDRIVQAMLEADR